MPISFSIHSSRQSNKDAKNKNERNKKKIRKEAQDAEGGGEPGVLKEEFRGKDYCLGD